MEPLPHPTRPRANQDSLPAPTRLARVLLLNTVPLLKMDIAYLQDLKVSLLSVVKDQPLNMEPLLHLDLADRLELVSRLNVVNHLPLSMAPLLKMDHPNLLVLKVSLPNVDKDLLLNTVLLLNLVFLAQVQLDLVSQPSVVSHQLLNTVHLPHLDLRVHLKQVHLLHLLLAHLRQLVLKAAATVISTMLLAFLLLDLKASHLRVV